MTHNELLTKIDSELVTHGQRGNIVKHSFALRAVVEYLKKMYDWEETWKGDMPMTMEQLGRREERIRITAELKELIEKELG